MTAVARVSHPAGQVLYQTHVGPICLLRRALAGINVGESGKIDNDVRRHFIQGGARLSWVTQIRPDLHVSATPVTPDVIAAFPQIRHQGRTEKTSGSGNENSLSPQNSARSIFATRRSQFSLLNPS